MDYNKKTVDFIKKLRVERFLSQEDIARQMGLTKAAYNRIENNYTQLTVQNLYTISEILGVEIETILQFNKRKMVYNKNSIVMTNFNDGNLNITISSEELKDYLKSNFNK